jgi:hypothetical protein
MSLPLAVAVIIIADVALIGLLAFVMSRAKLLTPHASSAAVASRPQRAAARAVRSHRHAPSSRTPVRVGT